MKTATEKYNTVLEGTLNKKEFVRQMRQQFPNFISQFNGFDDSVQILKNKGMIFEVKKEEAKYPEVNISLDVIERGIDIELAAKDIDPVGYVSKEQYLEAKRKAVHNLTLNLNHYIDLMAGESNKVDKNDKAKEFKKGEEVDVPNGMKKAELKENTKPSLRESVVLAIEAINNEYKNIPGVNHIIKEFIKTHAQDIMNGANSVEQFNEYISKNYEALSKTKTTIKEEDVSHLQQVIDLIYDAGQIANDVPATATDFMEAIGQEFEIDFEFGRQKEESKTSIDEKEGVPHFTKDGKEWKGKVHKMPDGSLMSGNPHDENGSGPNGESEKLHHKEDLNEEDVDTEGYVELMGPNFDTAVESLVMSFEEWKSGPMTEPSMVPHAKKDVLSYLDTKLDRSLSEKKANKDFDGDGKIESGEEEYKGSKDKAIKNAMSEAKTTPNKSEDQLKEAVKMIIKKVLKEEVITEAATAQLSKFGEEYSDFGGTKLIVNQLENIVTEIESFYDRINGKVSEIFNKMGEVTNEEGLKVGGFIAPALENSFRQDLRPVQKSFLTSIELPRIKTISKSDIDRAKAGGELEEEPKQTLFTPVVESKSKKKK